MPTTKKNHKPPFTCHSCKGHNVMFAENVREYTLYTFNPKSGKMSQNNPDRETPDDRNEDVWCANTECDEYFVSLPYETMQRLIAEYL